MNLKIDLHVHTTDSSDSFVKLEELPSILERRGIDGVAVTNHDICSDVPVLDGTIIPGIEVSTLQGHVLGLGRLSSVPSGRSADDTISSIHDLGGVAIIPHPFDPVSPCVDPSKLRSRPDAIEVINSDALLYRLNTLLAKRAAQQLGLPMVAGSDSHIPESVGDAYTLVDSDSGGLDGILDAIKAGSVQPVGRPTSRTKKLLKLGRRARSLQRLFELI